MKTYKVYINEEEIDIGKVEDLGLAITLAIADSNEITTRKKANTKTLKFPATNRNKLIFGHPEDFNSVVSINQSEKPSVKIEADGAIIFVGYIKITAVTDMRGKLIEYTGNCIGTNGDWIQRIGAAKMNALDYSDQNHTNDITTITNSEYANTGVEYVYDLIDRGEFTGQEYTVSGRKRRGVNIQDRFPALRIKPLLQRIFKAIGYTIESSFIDSTFFGKLYWMFINEELKHPDTFNATLVSSVQCNQKIKEISAPGGSPYTFTILRLNTPLTWTVVTASSAWQYNTQSHYFCLGRGKYTFNASVSFGTTAFGYPNNQTSGGDYLGQVVLRYKKVNQFKDGQAYVAGYNSDSPAYIRPATNGLVSGSINNFTATFDLEFGDEIYLELQYYFLRVLGNEYIEVSQTTFQCTKVEGKLGMGENQYVDWAYNLPDASQIDFIVALKELFNWHIVTDVGSRKVYIEPRDDFYNEESENWSAYLDNKKEITSEFLGSNLSQIMRYRYKKDGNDKFVELWEKQNNKIFGANEVDSENAFAKDGTSDVENTLFAPTWMDRCERIGLETATIPRMWSAETMPKRSQKFEPRILYYDGLKTVANSGFWRMNPNGTIKHQTNNPVDGVPLSPTNGKRTTYPLFYSFDDTQVNENNLMYDDRHYSSGLFEKYFRNAHKIADEGRRFSMYFYLNDTQIENINFRKPKYIEKDGNGTYFILEKVDNYKSQDATSTLCALTKVLSSRPIKALRYTTGVTQLTYGTIQDVGGAVGTSQTGGVVASGVEVLKRGPGGDLTQGGGEVVKLEENIITPIYFKDSDGKYKIVLMKSDT